jgi:HK97 family phage major capsid protein
MNRGRFFLHRELLGVIQRVKNATTGEYVWKPSPATGAEPTIWGKPYTLVDVLPSLTDDDEDTPFMIFGDLNYVTLGMRTDLQIKVFDSGTVGDPEEDDQDANTLNLLTQDLQAMRAVKRMNSRVRFPSAFSVIKTGVSGS